MGIYTTNRSQIAGINVDDIPVDESYVGMVGLERFIVESYQNEMTIFEAILRQDIQEIQNIKEGAILESEMEALNEASMHGLIEVAHTALNKAVSAITGAIQKFIEGFVNKVEAANNTLLEKIRSASLKKNLENVKYKWAEPSGKLNNQYLYSIALFAMNTYKHEEDKIKNAKNADDINVTSGEYANRLLTDWIKDMGGSETSIDKFSSDAMKAAFAEPVDKTGISEEQINKAVDFLKGYKQAKKFWKDKDKEVRLFAKEGFKALDDMKKIVSKEKKSENMQGPAFDAALMAKKVAGCRTLLSDYETAIGKIVHSNMAIQRKLIGQSRSILMKALIASGKGKEKEDAKTTEEKETVATEEAALLSIIDECVEYELDQFMGY